MMTAYALKNIKNLIGGIGVHIIMITHAQRLRNIRRSISVLKLNKVHP